PSVAALQPFLKYFLLHPSTTTTTTTTTTTAKAAIAAAVAAVTTLNASYITFTNVIP
ncbi:hypothetical protein WUBG_10708, partial [Wuchereria bancrofti]